MLKPGKMDFCKKCKYYKKVKKCTHPYFASPVSEGPMGPEDPRGGGGPGGGTSVLVPGGGSGMAEPPVYDCPFFEEK